ncbi:MAG: hypothetical protein DMG07_01115 [Acidobacteria bacterium]|nr:MAG: hypothetical protein DMG07_01115 [Acidobacteriota bacterium]
MTTDCNAYRDRIPRALLEDLPPEELRALQAHLAACPQCAQENERYAATVGALETAARGAGVDVPRHFFVYPAERGMGLRELFALLSPALRAALFAAGAAVALLTIVGASLTWLLARESALTRLAPQAVDVPALRAELLRLVDEKSRADKLELARELRGELARFWSASNTRERAMLESALTSLEGRVNERIVGTANQLEERTGRAVASAYQSVETKQRQDLLAIDDRLSRLAATGEQKNDQTNAILETLLEVAELRLDRTSR